jgi:hypothetical protein
LILKTHTYLLYTRHLQPRSDGYIKVLIRMPPPSTALCGLA